MWDFTWTWPLEVQDMTEDLTCTCLLFEDLIFDISWTYPAIRTWDMSWFLPLNSCSWTRTCPPKIQDLTWTDPLKTCVMTWTYRYLRHDLNLLSTDLRLDLNLPSQDLYDALDSPWKNLRLDLDLLPTDLRLTLNLLSKDLRLDLILKIWDLTWTCPSKTLTFDIYLAS